MRLESNYISIYAQPFGEWCLQRNLHLIALVDKAHLVEDEPETFDILRNYETRTLLIMAASTRAWNAPRENPK